MLQFDWDDENRGHIAAHDVSCAEAEQVIKNEPFDLEFQTEKGEERFVQLGETNAGRILVVVSTWRKTDYSVRCTQGDETHLHRPEGEFV